MFLRAQHDLWYRIKLRLGVAQWVSIPISHQVRKNQAILWIWVWLWKKRRCLCKKCILQAKGWDPYPRCYPIFWPLLSEARPQTKHKIGFSVWQLENSNKWKISKSYHFPNVGVWLDCFSYKRILSTGFQSASSLTRAAGKHQTWHTPIHTCNRNYTTPILFFANTGEPADTTSPLRSHWNWSWKRQVTNQPLFLHSRATAPGIAYS